MTVTSSSVEEFSLQRKYDKLKVKGSGMTVAKSEKFINLLEYP
jgi:hypothetical protein